MEQHLKNNRLLNTGNDIKPLNFETIEFKLDHNLNLLNKMERTLEKRHIFIERLQKQYKKRSKKIQSLKQLHKNLLLMTEKYEHKKKHFSFAMFAFLSLFALLLFTGICILMRNFIFTDTSNTSTIIVFIVDDILGPFIAEQMFKVQLYFDLYLYYICILYRIAVKCVSA